MALFALTQTPAPPGVGAGCLRNQFPRHVCQACVDVCPVNAISLEAARPKVDASECLHCGHCLFVCPVDALQNLQPPARPYKALTLVAPFSAIAPEVEELLMWHHQYHIRAVEMDMAQYPAWARAVAALNIRLREFNAPGWQILAPQVKGVNIARRSLLQISEADVRSAAVCAGPRARRRAFSTMREYRLLLTQNQCLLCGACTRACPEKALRFNDDVLEWTASLCTGCNNCAVVCPTQAIRTEKQVGQNISLRFPCALKYCACCQRKFYTFDPKAQRCHICLRHPYGMREA
ncbi:MULTISPECIES: 4Fe-4S binding protein [Tenebrionibacter/Tenebrionicola group]|nr:MULTISPECIES: 4Fe-4S binding protein [Tenebrionibacter/Tenebrionicola group]